MKVSLHSNIGKRRKSNQDYANYYINDQQDYLFVLCDGVGGSQAGDIASQQTVEFIGRAFLDKAGFSDQDPVEDWIHEVIHQVNQTIYQESLTQEDRQGMSTTLVMALVVRDQLYIAHVGDSRAYAYQQGTLDQLTEDHSLVNELIRSGELTTEEGAFHPQRNVVTQAIGGTDQVDYECSKLPVEGIDVLMLCSDGLTNMVSHDHLLEFFANHDLDENLAERLIQAANDAGGADNITVIIVSHLSSTYPEEADLHG